MTDELKRVIGHDIDQLGKGWANFVAGSIGAATPKQHLQGMQAILRELGVVLQAAVKAEV